MCGADFITTFRIIPCLLVRDGELVKTVRFSKPRYVGDPVNAVRIFSAMGVHELVVLDISATPKGRTIDANLVAQMADEASMPLAVGGGIRSVDHASVLIGSGAEKLVMNNAAVVRPSLIGEVTAEFGSQSVVGSIDVKHRGRGTYDVRGANVEGGSSPSVLDLASVFEEQGAGELLITSTGLDGTRSGYDIELLKLVTEAVRVPVIACGGAGSLRDMVDVISRGGASAAAAGSMFVFHGRRQAVLLSYPTPDEIRVAEEAAQAQMGIRIDSN